MSRCGQSQTVLFTSSFMLTLMAGAHETGSAYTFSINGEPIRPVHYSLSADESVFAPGDVIHVGDGQFNYGGLHMTLGDEKDCRFVTISPKADDSALQTSVKDGRVFLELPDGRRRIVAVSVTWSVRRKETDPNEQTEGEDQGVRKRPSFDRVAVNPLDSMSPEEIHGLWGIYLNHWPEGIEQKLAHVNTDRVCITISDFAGVGTRSLLAGQSLPPIPLQTRYLIVKETMSPGLSDFSHLSRLRDLVFLKFESFPREPLDVGLICQNTGLRYLDISGCGIPNYQKLASLTELRILNIARCREIDNLEFVRDMRQLRVLYMGLTKISSLSPLDNSDSIREIHAGMAEVRDLPRGDLDSLQAINLISTRVNAQTVTEFRTAHPMCKVEYGWADSLRSAVRGTTRLRVRSGGTCHRVPAQEQTLAEITRAEEIERFLDGIQINESQSGFHCMCCGNPTFEFYAGDRLLAMVGYHHGRSLRWAEGQWTGDGQLTDTSQSFLISWLAKPR